MVDRLPIGEIDLYDSGSNGHVSPIKEELLEVRYESDPGFFETAVNTFYHRNPDETVNVERTNKDRKNMLDGLVEGCVAPLELEYDGVTYRRHEGFDENGLLAIAYILR